LLALIAVLAVSRDTSAAATSTTDPGSDLHDGFVVPRGARLLGSIVPNSISTTPPGWGAYLWLNGDAVSVFDAVTRQFASRGMGSIGPSPSCSQQSEPGGLPPHSIGASPPTTDAATTTPTAVTCRGSYSGAGLDASLRITVCRSCIYPAAFALLSVQESGAQRPPDAEQIAALPESTSTAKLTRAEQRRAKAAIPRTGQRFTNELTRVEFPAVPARSKALAPAIATGGCSTGVLESLLSLSGNAGAAAKRLLRQSPRPDVEQRMLSRRTLGQLTSTRYLYGYYTTLTVVDGPSLDRPIALVEWCND
jgi:hypothetical protein